MVRTKEQLAEYHKKWREQNKDLLAAYKERNKERIAIRQREYAERNRERILTKKREHRIKTTEQRRAYNAEWYRKNRERKYAYDLAKRRANKDKIREYTRAYHLARPWNRMLHTAKKRCKATGMEFSLTADWAKARWTGKCEISGVEMFSGVGGQCMRSPTIDRKDAKAGYTPDNCRFVCLALNAMRGDGTDEEMMDLIHATLEFSMSGATRIPS